MKRKNFKSIYNSILNVIGGVLIALSFFGCGGAIDYYEELSGDYLFYGGDGDGIQSHKPNRASIYGKVIRYKFDNNFIVALQRPDYRDYKNMISFHLRSDEKKYPENSSQDIIKSGAIADSLLRYSPYYKKIFSSKENYWIISHKNEKVYGPLTKSEYQLKRKELRIPEDLQLE